VVGRQGAVSRQGEILAELEAAISCARPREIQDALRHLIAAAPAVAEEAAARKRGAPGAGPPGPAPSPSPRRPRRPDVVTYRVRAVLTETGPPLWRRIELASDLFLNEVHEVIQAAFGWTGSHLHRFSAGPDFYDEDAEHYLCPLDVAEGETGVPEDRVRLDELLSEAGDELFYAYGFGDGWEHVLRLEAVSPRDQRAPRAVCTGGDRPGPAEDCGGVSGYELIVAAADPAHPGHDRAVTEFARTFGGDLDPAAIGTTPFDLEAINRALAGRGAAAGAGGASPATLPRPVADLLGAVRTPGAKRQLLRLLEDADLRQPVQVDAGTAARMVRPYTWLLNRAAPDGIKLTDAGHLPPAHVKAAMAELSLPAEPGGRGSRENRAIPVLHLRESAQALGLLRKHRGRLLLTARGSALREDPVALWWHLAGRMPFGTFRSPEVQAGLVLLICVAARFTGAVDHSVARMLGAIGWANGNGTPLTPAQAAEVTRRTGTMLRRLGVLPPEPAPAPRPAPEGVTFARAALVTWAQPA
jgi:hypothetical protein